MASHKQVILEVEGPVLSPAPVTVRREKPTGGGRWRLGGALLAVALCATGFLCFAFNKPHRSADESDEITHTLRQISESAKAAIHLSGDYNPVLSNMSVEWRDGEDQSFAEGGLKLKNNEIYVPRNGWYFVYSQATYRVSCATKDDRRDIVHLSHEVSRWSGSYDSWKPLLSAVRSACKLTPAGGDDGEEQWFTAVYLGAVFNLQAGDRLRTVMDAERLHDIEGDNGKTFFGVFSL
ncbi:tumor necrosis factor a (TNF superfamily, member 2) [Brachyhypopomus gauderio]|uniref:tumor necrosis factor a (TNF superfamily, member 2) n=1 Tax=Brachyhypopomus gauderio TaxID=698409 RepID=UPI004042378B